LIPSPAKYKTRRYILKGKYLKCRFGNSCALFTGVNRIPESQKEEGLDDLKEGKFFNKISLPWIYVWSKYAIYYQRTSVFIKVT